MKPKRSLLKGAFFFANEVAKLQQKIVDGRTCWVEIAKLQQKIVDERTCWVWVAKLQQKIVCKIRVINKIEL